MDEDAHNRVLRPFVELKVVQKQEQVKGHPDRLRLK